MTIGQIYENDCMEAFFSHKKGYLFCRWYDEKEEKLKAEDFSPLALDIVSSTSIDNPIKIGDIVQLKSGSPKYVVLDESASGDLILEGVDYEIERCTLKQC